MSSLQRYTLFQVPGWALAAALLVWLWPVTGLPSWLGWLAWLLWVAKDYALYPMFRNAYRSDAATGAARLVGSRGVARSSLTPRGYIVVNGERWRAEAAEGAAPIAASTRVRVEGADGLTLRVVPEEH